MTQLMDSDRTDTDVPEGFSQRPDGEDPQESKDRAWHDWMMVAVGLTALVSVLALIVGIVALSSSSSPVQTVAAASTGGSQPTGSAAPVAKPQSVALAVKADDEHGRLGPDKKWHDAFLPGGFTVHAGATVTVTVTNYDGGPHSFTSPAMNVNATIPGGGSMSAPQKTTFTFTAPHKAGKYQWWCSVPCDPWAMSHNGYMRGFVTVTD